MKQDDDENIVYAIPVDDLLHTPGHPFCYDPVCTCHTKQDMLAQVAEYVQDGLMTPEEATDFVAGKTI